MPIRLANTQYASKGKPKEVDIQRVILQWLKLKGIFAFRVNTGGLIRRGRWVPSPNTTKGVSDIVAIKKWNFMKPSPVPYIPVPCMSEFGQFVAIEVKRPGQKPSADQKAFLDSVTKAGGIAIIATCLRDVMEVFE